VAAATVRPILTDVDVVPLTVTTPFDGTTVTVVGAVALAGAIAANGANTKDAITPSAMRLDVFIDIYFLSKYL